MIIRINKLTFLFCLLLTLSVSVSAASEAEYKKLAKSWTLHADGSQEFRYTMELTLFTHTAMNGTYGESFIVYNPDFQELKIHTSYTQQKDGNIVETPDNAFVEVLPRSAADAPAYNHLKEMVVVHTGLELGATIYLDYSVISKPGYLSEIDLYEELLQSSPAKDYTLTVTVPSDKALHYSVANVAAKAQTKQAGSNTSYVWNWRNLPAFSRDPFVSVSNGDQPCLTASTLPTADALASLFKQFNAGKDAQLETLAESLTEGKANDENKLEAILKYTTNRIANSPLPLEAASYRFRRADAVINTAYGTEIEKINLLAGLLNGAGFRAEPMAAYRIVAEKGLGLKAIGQFFVSCMVDGQTYLFSSNSTRCPAISFEQMPLYSLADGQPVAVAIHIPGYYRIESHTTLTFDKETVTASTHESVGDGLKPYFSSAKSESSKNMPMKVENGYATIELQDAAVGFSHLPYGTLGSRRSDNLLLPRLVDEEYTYTIECPAHMDLRTPATDKQISNAAGKLTFSVKKNGKTATVTRSLQLNKQLYTPAEYAALRTLLTEWGSNNGNTLLFSVQ